MWMLLLKDMRLRRLLSLFEIIHMFPTPPYSVEARRWVDGYVKAIKGST